MAPGPMMDDARLRSHHWHLHLPVALIIRGSIDIHHLEFYNCVSRMMPPPLAAHGTESLRRKIEGLHGAAS